MHYDHFVQKVQEYSGMRNFDEAEKVTRATLETIGERLPKTHRQHLATQLPVEMKEFLPKSLRMQYLTLEEFYQRIGNRTNTGYSEAVKNAKTVVRVLHEAVASGELEDILATFPLEYNELFGRKPSGPLSSSHP
jgi:uncharacterized protein (DUF2267 family)